MVIMNTRYRRRNVLIQKKEDIENWEHITSLKISFAVVTMPMHILFAVVGNNSEKLIVIS